MRDITSDAIAADERAQAIGTVLEELLAGDPTLDDLPDLLFAGVTGIELGEPAYDDDGVSSSLSYEVGFRSYLS